MSADQDSGKGMTAQDHDDARYKAELDELRGKGLTNAEVAELLPEAHRSRFWREKLDIFFAAEASK